MTETNNTMITAGAAKRKPSWLRVKALWGPDHNQLNRLLKRHRVDTVCRAANCPNRGECFGRGTATFLILGPVCTRACRFCDIKPGIPLPPDPDEPRRVAAAAGELKLTHIVVTSVTRDDLADGGAARFAQVTGLLRQTLPAATVELLTPDFAGSTRSFRLLLDCTPDVFNHNVETVPRLYSQVRPQADYRRSLDLLGWMQENSTAITKSGIMVGLGESLTELKVVFADLAARGVAILTIGQYLAPSRQHLPVHRYLPPEEFDMLADEARQAGIPTVISAPLVRSSYRAERALAGRLGRHC
ncbi:MAG: lipoyl synthase [bacterium]